MRTTSFHDLIKTLSPMTIRPSGGRKIEIRTVTYIIILHIFEVRPIQDVGESNREGFRVE